MRLTKLGHACVRIEHEGAVIVIDPGAFTAAGATEDATAVLVTHEHADHWTPEHLRVGDARVFTIAAVADQIREQAPEVAERLTVVSPGERLDVGVPVEVVGEDHAVIHPELPALHNSGFLLDVGGTTVLHPGDALTVPGTTPDLLLLPVSAPWLKASECIDFARDVGAPRSLAIHDEIYSDLGLGFLASMLEGFLEPTGQEYLRLEPGQDLADFRG